MKVIILCGGKGTRLQSVLEGKPKPLAEVQGKPILASILETIETLCDSAIIVAPPFDTQIKTYVETLDLPYPVVVINQDSQHAGPHMALVKAKEFLGTEPFLVLYGDNYYAKADLENMIRLSKAPTIGIYKGVLQNGYRGIWVEENVCKGFSNDSKKDLWVFTGSYLLDGTYFLLESEKIKDEYSIIDTLMKHCPVIHTYELKNWHQVNTLEDLETVTN